MERCYGRGLGQSHCMYPVVIASVYLLRLSMCCAAHRNTGCQKLPALPINWRLDEAITTFASHASFQRRHTPETQRGSAELQRVAELPLGHRAIKEILLLCLTTEVSLEI